MPTPPAVADMEPIIINNSIPDSFSHANIMNNVEAPITRSLYTSKIKNILIDLSGCRAS